MKWAIFMVLALAISGCTTQSGTNDEVTASKADQNTGTIRYPNGNVYTGQLKDGKPHGQGTNRWLNGDRYTGRWRNGLEHGRGTYVSTRTGISYKGPFRNGVPNGAGTCILLSVTVCRRTRNSWVGGCTTVWFQPVASAVICIRSSERLDVATLMLKQELSAPVFRASLGTR